MVNPKDHLLQPLNEIINCHTIFELNNHIVIESPHGYYYNTIILQTLTMNQKQSLVGKYICIKLNLQHARAMALKRTRVSRVLLEQV